MNENDINLIRYSEFWDEKWYLSQYQDVAESKRGALEHFCMFGNKENRNPSARFDMKRYRVLYETGNINPLLHFEMIGKYKGIVPPITDYLLIKKSKYFSKKYYKKKYLRGMNVDPISHYLTEGWKKGFSPSKKFCGEEYLNRNQGVRRANICPLIHYERNGKFEGREIYPCNRPLYKEKGLLWKLLQKIILILFRIINNRIVNNGRFLIALHIFYPESWPEIKCYLDNFSIYNYDLVVTYPRGGISEDILQSISNYRDGVIIVPEDNRGFDIGPFIDVINRIDLSNYDAVIKLHSKGISRPSIYMYGHYYCYKDWFNVLFRGVSGIINSHKTIRKIFNRKIGIVAAKEVVVNDPVYKQELVKKSCVQFEMPYLDNYRFVAGTCMAFKTSVLQYIKKYGLSIENFEVTTRGEFSFAHFIERELCIFSEINGYKISGNQVIRLKFYELLHKNKICKYSAQKLLNDSRFDIDDNFYYRVLERQQIEKYSVEKMRLGDIKRYFNGEYYSLTSCAPYRYLLGYRNEYFKYSEYHKDNNLPLMTKIRFDNLIQSIEEKGFDTKNMPVVNQDNVIQDGQHRSCYLLFKYGEDFEMPVVKIWYKNRVRKKEFYREYRKGFMRN